MRVRVCGWSHVVGADQAAHGLQGAEGVVLAVVMAAAGVPDQVAALLVGQDVRRGALGRGRGQQGPGRQEGGGPP